MSKALLSFEMSRTLYVRTLHGIAEDLNLQHDYCENLQPYSHMSVTSVLCTEGPVEAEWDEAPPHIVQLCTWFVVRAAHILYFSSRF
jgi:hypothetical protein